MTPGEHVDVGEPDRVSHSPSLGEQVEPDHEGHDQQGQEEPGPLERHEPPPQTAPACSTARTPSYRSARANTRIDSVTAHCLRASDASEQRRVRRGSGVEADRVPGRDQPLTCRAGGDRANAPRPDRNRAHPANRRLRPEETPAACGTGTGPGPTAGRRKAADVRPEHGRANRSSGVDAAEHDGTRRRRPRTDRTAEQSREVDVDRAVAQLRVEPADDEAARTRELELRAVRASSRAGRERRPTARARARRPGGRDIRSSRRRYRRRRRKPAASTTPTRSRRFTGSSGTRVRTGRRRPAAARPSRRRTDP